MAHPLGYQFLRDHTGTLDVTPDDERQELDDEFSARTSDPTLTSPPHTPLAPPERGYRHALSDVSSGHLSRRQYGPQPFLVVLRKDGSVGGVHREVQLSR